MESEHVIDSRQQPPELETPEPFYNFTSRVSITTQDANVMKLNAVTLALNIPRINPNNDIFNWTRSTGVNPGPFSIQIPNMNYTPVELMLEIATLMSAADGNANYSFTNPYESVYRITSVPSRIISAVSGSFFQSLLFDMPIAPARLGTDTIEFLCFQDVVIPNLYLRIQEFTKYTTYKSTSAGNMTDHTKALDLAGGHKLVRFAFQEPVRLEFLKQHKIPTLVRFALETPPGTPLLKSYYPGGVLPTNAYALYYFTAIN